jgi:hypothetical protein
MASLNDFGLPGTHSGILHPKMSNQFMVRFAMTLPAGAEPDPALERALEVFSSQVCEVSMPVRKFNAHAATAPRGPARGDAANIIVDGALTLRLQDDKANIVTHAVEQLIKHTPASSLEIAVSKLDGNDGILETFYFGAELLTVVYSTLDYAAGSWRHRGVIEDRAQLDAAHMPHTLHLSLSSARGNDEAAQYQTLAFKVRYAQHQYRKPA